MPVRKSLYRQESTLLRQSLRQARRAAGLSQVELGEVLERPQSWVSQVERGVRRLDLVELSDYCQALGVDLTQFVQAFHAELESLRQRSGND
ncbi:transcriptional regulator [Lysobacteraceae bacterium NML71-0210]|nr:transcriptional regulator [Xanthomonadaceae bacterium NML71-0210]